ncbi:MAG: carboxypeptidase regulatory-like domain-containing protein, partial [Acidobacteria bacterium]|nr:carboxypeptidase regulatory-like domain-containing protein [Acidobacteriota bacterium]
MARSRPAALILAVALPGTLVGTLGLARAQQISTARVVPSTTPPVSSPTSATAAPVFSNSGPVAAGGPAPTSTTSKIQAPSPATLRSAGGAAGTGLAGRVTGNASPLAAAGVYAYQLADLALFKVMTDAQGNFLFRDLPAGLYKIIAHKPGFLPVVIMVTRDTAKAYQFLELQLAQRAAPGAGPRDSRDSREIPADPSAARKTGAADSADGDFWALRARIPPDVLRDIEASDAPGTEQGETKSAEAGNPGNPAAKAASASGMGSGST